MQIDERRIGDALVLDLKGKMTLGEGDELLKKKIASVLARGDKRIVLNLQEVPYIDSAGLGEVVRSYILVSRNNGRMQLMDPTKRILDLLANTKLLTVIEVLSADDLVFGREAEQWTALCPRCKPATSIRLRREDEYQSCARCGLGIKFSGLPALKKETAVQCDRFRLATYEGEHVLLQIGQRHEITVRGRLDLFASEIVAELWNLITTRRRVLVIADGSEVSDAGLQRVLMLCDSQSEPSHAAIFLKGVPVAPPSPLLSHRAVHNRYEAAVEALGAPGSKLPGIAIQVRYSTT
jgi:anti-sigma B factor antagonist